MESGDTLKTGIFKGMALTVNIWHHGRVPLYTGLSALLVVFNTIIDIVT